MAGGDVKISADRDVMIAGGNIVGERVSLDVGRDLSILSPQVEGWRDGFSFGLTVGVGAFGIRGSYEEGDKAWSSGSSIVAEKGIDILVGEDTVLNGALLQATDGDIKLDTKTLTVSDNHDKDEYLNVGGSIGISGNRLDTLSFHYEEKDKQGETRTTLDAAGNLDVTVRDADGDGVENTEADKAAAEELIAGINKDASRWQEITKDDYTKISGELDVKNLLDFGKNAEAVGNYVEAMNAPVPDNLAAEGDRAVDVWRKLIISGATPEQATEVSQSESFHSLVQRLGGIDQAVEVHGGFDSIPEDERLAIAYGYALVYSEIDGQPVAKVRVPCSTNSSGCELAVNDFIAGLKNHPEVRDQILAAQTDEALQALYGGKMLNAALAFENVLLTCSLDPDVAAAQLARIYDYDPSTFNWLASHQRAWDKATLINAMADYQSNPDKVAAERDFLLASQVSLKIKTSETIDTAISIANGAYELTPVADGVAVIQAAVNGDIAGIVIAGIGFVPIAKAAKLLGSTSNIAIEAVLKKGGKEAKEVAEEVAIAANRASHEAYKDALLASMEKPAVADKSLAHLVDWLYRPNASIGSGSTAAAVRHELSTGQAVGGALHSQKAEDGIRALQKWLDSNPTATPSDRAAAENIIRDMSNALRGQ